MKLILALVVTSFVVLTAKKVKKVPRDEEFSSSEENEHSSQELLSDKKLPFDLNGTIRRSFAMEAAYTDPNRNIICSPLIALLPLGKLILGTVKGKSRDELLEAIGTNQTSVKRKLRLLLHDLKYLPGVTLTVASRLFVNKSMEISKEYLANIKSIFLSTLEKVDFRKPVQSAKKINDWVSTHTVGLIPYVISPSDISPQSSMLLVSAVYFKGFWKIPFKNLFVGNFHTPLGIRKIPLMTQRAYYNYVQSEILSAKIIEIPYEDDKASFVVVLPLSRIGLRMLLSQLKVAPELLNKEVAKMTRQLVTLTMPKFKAQTELDLKDLYEKLGVTTIFTKNSGLDRISRNTPIYVTKATQRACIEVTEMGSEGAVASDLAIEKTSYIPSKHFIADHPFLFFVKIQREQLFFGVVTEPNEKRY